MEWYKRIFGIVSLCSLVAVQKVYAAPSISNIDSSAAQVFLYEKWEVNFDVSSSATHPFFEYTTDPPPGVEPAIGVSVTGNFITPSGKQLFQPAFYQTIVDNVGSGNPLRFVETAQKTWSLRFSPQEIGTYQVSLKATDATGTVIVPVGSFQANTGTKPGYIRVSSQDPRYFEYSNGQLHWPIGPAWLDSSNAYANYLGTGLNFERYWMGGIGAYSTNWSRWISSAEQHGNEGYMARLSYIQHAPDSELSYEMIYPAGYRTWIPCWGNEVLCQDIVAGHTYQVKLRLKTANITAQNSVQPYGLFIKTHDWWSINDPITTQIRNRPNVLPPISQNADWREITDTFTAPDGSNDISLYFDNVISGEAFIDEFSVREILAGGDLGGEQIRSNLADIHTYVDPRGAAFFDWQLEQAEKNGVAIQYVVHDKNDWVQNHLDTVGQWVANNNADGYYQPENTKARWLLRQWYRYLIARYGYSTALRGWELNNEGPPPNPDIADITDHMQTTQAFAANMHQNDSHPHLASTSFWCCWRPDSWNHPSMVDLDYADLHDYITNNGSAVQEYTGQSASPFDEVDWMMKTDQMIVDSHIGKPSMRGETGIGSPGEPAFILLSQANPGIWYHNLLWAQLHPGALFDPNYWWSEHITKINRQTISQPFFNFVTSLDLNQGGYIPTLATANNSNIRVIGQQHPSGKAILWIQNKQHTWKNVIDGITLTPITATVSVPGFTPNTTFPIVRYNTYNGTSESDSLTSNVQGTLSLAITNLTDDLAIKIGVFTPGLTPTPALIGDLNSDGYRDFLDLILLIKNFDSIGIGDLLPEPGVNIFDYNKLLQFIGL